jgi:hypothetical protein
MICLPVFHAASHSDSGLSKMNIYSVLVFGLATVSVCITIVPLESVSFVRQPNSQNGPTSRVHFSPCLVVDNWSIMYLPLSTAGSFFR